MSFGAASGNSFDTPQAGTDAAFANDMESADLPGGADMRATA